MVEGRNGLIAAAEEDALTKVVPKALHCELEQSKELGISWVSRSGTDLAEPFPLFQKPVYIDQGPSLIETAFRLCTAVAEAAEAEREMRRCRRLKRERSKDVQERTRAKENNKITPNRSTS
jgi:hypothetical protein